ncbi:hypothetical protein GF323_01180 [Candidatus Woesearchaeota archaeon]|nr:hypothetical protein [Candidatus Woesearchaeota archaeon]
MIESYTQALEEFKRVDHLFYVTLKYTRTVDVIRSVIERLKTTYEYSIDALLKCLKEEKIIEDIPKSPVVKAQWAKEKCEDEKIRNYIDMYLMLRRIMRVEYRKREEFRRHVTMMINMDGKQMDIDIDLLNEYFEQTKEFLKYIKDKVDKYKE